MTSLLHVMDLSVSYGGVQAVRCVELNVQAGRLTGLIGPNGAGKTSLIDAITGFAGARGSIELEGRQIASWKPHRRAAAGLARTWQGADLFDDLSVQQNVAVAAERPSRPALLQQILLRRRHTPASVEEALAVCGLGHLRDASTLELSHGQRKLVGVARAIATQPKVLCVDEPAAGLNVEETRDLAALLKSLTACGMGLLLVDHDMSLVMSACDDIVVLDFGAVIATGSPAEVQANQRVIDAYLGGAGAARRVRT